MYRNLVIFVALTIIYSSYENIYILLIGFVLLCMSGYSQDSTFVKGKGYTGYVFNKEHFLFMMGSDNQKGRYTPTKEDIAQVEKILKDSIDSYLKRERIYTRSIKKNKLRKYKRQYLGFITKDGDIVIFISFLKGYYDKDELSKELIQVCDGGEDYWTIYINLTKHTLYEIQINGIA